METLELPSPASELLDAVHEALVDLILPIAPGNTPGRLGGGTTLAARWRHRNSTDIDVTVPEGTGLGRYHPDRDTTLIDRMEAAGATRVDLRFRAFIFTFPDGKIDLVEMDPRPGAGHGKAVVDGKIIDVCSNAQILAGKLFGRGSALPERDVFDLAVAAEVDPFALRVAANYLDPDSRREVVHRIRAQADLYRKNAPHMIMAPAPEWRSLIADAPERAATAVEGAAYAHVSLEYDNQGIHLVLGATRTTPEQRIRFGSGESFADGIPELGLEPCFLQNLGTREGIVRHTDEKLRIWRSAASIADTVFDACVRAGDARIDTARNRTLLDTPAPHGEAIENAIHSVAQAAWGAITMPGSADHGALAARARALWPGRRDDALRFIAREPPYRIARRPISHRR